MYNQLIILPTDRILVVAPHPDDETVGCGGLLALYRQQCDVLLLTDGRKGVPADRSKTEAETAQIRKAEFETVMDFFGVLNYRELGIRDSSLRENVKAVCTVDLTGYDWVFVPNRNERHPDHAATYRIIKKLRKKQRAKARLIEYEVWSPIIAPNRFLDISAAMETKTAALEKYASQVAEINYVKLAQGLNSYRGAPHHVEFCEAFFLEPERRKRLARMLPACLRRTLAKLRGKRA